MLGVPQSVKGKLLGGSKEESRENVRSAKGKVNFIQKTIRMRKGEF